MEFSTTFKIEFINKVGKQNFTANKFGLTDKEYNIILKDFGELTGAAYLLSTEDKKYRAVKFPVGNEKLIDYRNSLDNYKKYWLSDTHIKYRLFTSASPNEEIVKENTNIFGELYCPISIREFINEKWLAPITPLIYSEDNKNVNKIKYMLDDFTEKNRTFGFSFHNDCINAHEMFIKHVQLYNDKLTKIKPFLLLAVRAHSVMLSYIIF
jgi:hypothetical protein